VQQCGIHWDATLDWRKRASVILKADFEQQPPPQQTSPAKEEKELSE